jgi:hypothetical protein
MRRRRRKSAIPAPQTMVKESPETPIPSQTPLEHPALLIQRQFGNQFLQRSLSKLQRTNTIQRGWLSDTISSAQELFGKQETEQKTGGQSGSNWLTDTVNSAKEFFGAKEKKYTITDPKAYIRTDPPKLKSTGRTLAQGTSVYVIQEHIKGKKAYILVEEILGDYVYGPPARYWTSAVNVAGWESSLPAPKKGGNSKQNDNLIKIET